MPDPLRTRLLRAFRNGPWVPIAALAAVLAALGGVHRVLDSDAPVVVRVQAAPGLLAPRPPMPDPLAPGPPAVQVAPEAADTADLPLP